MAYWSTVGTVFALELFTVQAVVAWWRGRR